MIVRAVVVLAVLVAVLVVSVVLWPKARPGALAVATTTASVAPGGVLQGTIAAARSGDRVCFSATHGGSTSVLRFPSGWSSDSRLDLRDAAGGVVAQPGDTLIMLGRPGAIGSLPGCSVEGRIWTITSVRTASAR
jgi:predicted anti-sigma-YlaC factor YlaD